jgi:hypothetical protein
MFNTNGSGLIGQTNILLRVLLQLLSTIKKKVSQNNFCQQEKISRPKLTANKKIFAGLLKSFIDFFKDTEPLTGSTCTNSLMTAFVAEMKYSMLLFGGCQ